jgi:hypothetical protein
VSQRPSRRVLVGVLVLGAAAAAVAVALLVRTPQGSGTARVAVLVTDEYATHNPEAPESRHDEVWELTSGSLFVRDGVAWSGVPDGEAPGPGTGATGSAVFRAVTREPFDVRRLRLRLRAVRFVTTDRTPSTSWDGIHVLVGYRSADELHVVSVLRRDGVVVVKRKAPEGALDDGAYTDLGSTRAGVPEGEWIDVALDVRPAASGLSLSVTIDGTEVLVVGDLPAEAFTGRVGLRADNVELEVAEYVVATARSGRTVDLLSHLGEIPQ